MADEKEGVSNRKPGEFYILASLCVGCRTCDVYIEELVVQAGPVNRFVRQPKNDEERTACRLAMTICPKNAICEVADSTEAPTS